jgi:hypothetical protein
MGDDAAPEMPRGVCVDEAAPSASAGQRAEALKAKGEAFEHCSPTEYVVRSVRTATDYVARSVRTARRVSGAAPER